MDGEGAQKIQGVGWSSPDKTEISSSLSAWRLNRKEELESTLIMLEPKRRVVLETEFEVGTFEGVWKITCV